VAYLKAKTGQTDLIVYDPETQRERVRAVARLVRHDLIRVEFHNLIQAT